MSSKLRTDAVFHDGTPFDAAAAKANLVRAQTIEGSQRRNEIKSIQSIDTPDSHTLVLHLAEPDATLLAQLSDRAGMMLSPQSFANTDPAEVARQPVCSGPYQFVKRVQNDRIELKKFAQHYDAANFHYDNLTFLPMADTTVRLQNLKSGGIDILERLNPADIAEVKDDAELSFLPVTGLGYQEIFFNVNNGPKAQTILSPTN